MRSDRTKIRVLISHFSFILLFLTSLFLYSTLEGEREFVSFILIGAFEFRLYQQ